MKTAAVLLALVAAAFAAPTNIEEPTLAKRGCSAGDICISGSCYWRGIKFEYWNESAWITHEDYGPRAIGLKG
ncbi:hypothetical protein TRIATDRAFT_316033 [Trichoderma atroviride IMI 206040]|uniref:Uncharacterized protein n=1 Tax=Hypocrea atroviridis (strain ATCC 20476 / IMI 206040) TaxID=452589 RepID=G9NLU4_HYPAI|nr:uncharacterized protein TRIATDRAFT_316033 [Trichoderma atroviride IMI 206040]EHK48851.1 hypothetical protein TRIATDRAFT_316033 [Trichoderma atroviride IMI 206040]